MIFALYNHTSCCSNYQKTNLTTKMKLVATLAATVSAHARLMEPPGRSSLYLFPNDPDVKKFWNLVIPNYADNQLFCGGLSTEIENGYKCGVCGDNYADARPRYTEINRIYNNIFRENELGGKYDVGIIPRQFKNEATIPLVVQARVLIENNFTKIF